MTYSRWFAVPSEVAAWPSEIRPRPRSLAEIEAEIGIWHLNDVPWFEAPLPRRFHRCRPQTYGPGVVRCACGAIASTFGPWSQKNSRRRNR